jgi:hypothetical protein
MAGSGIVWESAAGAQSSPARALMSRVEVRDLGEPRKMEQLRGEQRG